ncbi:hypothetical protein JCM5296_002828 [Sporobolomyces johnsonii]
MTAAALQPTSMELPNALGPAQSTSPGRATASDYCLDVRQQPRQARMAGSGEKADRRPIDPPPIIRLRLRKPAARKKPSSALTDADLVAPTLTHTLFMFASLVPSDSEDELYDLTGSKSKHVAGSVVSSLFHLKDQSCFVFPDLSVRTEGRWRFKMSLYKIVEDGVHFCDSILTDVFQVYSSKRFPGMGKSTELSKSFAQQGLKLRIRRPGSKNEDEEEPAPPRRDRISPLVTRRPNASSTAEFQAPPPPPAPTQHQRRASGPSASSYYPPLLSSSSSASASAFHILTVTLPTLRNLPSLDLLAPSRIISLTTPTSAASLISMRILVDLLTMSQTHLLTLRPRPTLRRSLYPPPRPATLPHDTTTVPYPLRTPTRTHLHLSTRVPTLPLQALSPSTPPPTRTISALTP